MLEFVSRLPDKIQSSIKEKVKSFHVDIWWSRSTNEEGEEYSELYIDDGETHESLFEGSCWGWIENIEEAIEEIENKC